ncbi:MAG TPA: CinA family protein [Rhodopila sp.]|uniref:CinA family protein n=1 Tax=Rhodopila sp. TaxID=2480087 RepID=UPI002CD36EBD|nr:CinA family protein [Rhodopila sp.]HVY15834.1 CinA family protein [Rhodopila sp.]
MNEWTGDGMLPESTLIEAEALLSACRSKRIMLATAESCTGGLISAALTAIAGSSDVVDRGFVTYSNQAKSEAIGVPMALIETHGAVSQQVAAAMAEGALVRSQAAIAIAVTGVAGPGGGSADKPVGLVWFGLARTGSPAITDHKIFPGDRTEIRAATVAHALKMIRDSL